MGDRYSDEDWRERGLTPPAFRAATTYSPPADIQTSQTTGSVTSDPVNHPSHYTAHPSGVECIQITEHYGFCVGNAIKYLWRAGLKGSAIDDLKKAIWYINREIENRTKQEGTK
jgi:hypothetical protein